MYDCHDVLCRTNISVSLFPSLLTIRLLWWYSRSFFVFFLFFAGSLVVSKHMTIWIRSSLSISFPKNAIKCIRQSLAIIFVAETSIIAIARCQVRRISSGNEDSTNENNMAAHISVVMTRALANVSLTYHRWKSEIFLFLFKTNFKCSRT